MSFKTRLFGSYALIVVICLSLVAIAMSLLLQGYRDRLIMERLDNIARPISVQIRSLVTDDISDEELFNNLEEQANTNNVYILLLSNGNVVRQIPPGETMIEIPVSGLPQDISIATQGKFETSDGKTYIFAAYALRRLISYTELGIDTILLTVPQTGSLVIWASLIRPLMFSGIIALVVSLAIALLLARSVYRPLQQVTSAVQRIAEGNYDQQVIVNGPAEYRELATSFNDMVEKVKRSQQQLRHFVADVSHELKSPITAIQGFSQALVDGTAENDETRSKAARIINDEAKRMRRQVEELLDLSRMQSGQLKIMSEPVELNELLGHCIELFEIQAGEKGVTVKTKIELPVTIMGDADRLEQLFSNLLDNAIKNSPTGSEVHVTTSISINNYVEIKITDSGPGIPPEQLPYVFERFYQVTGVRTGVGLGLAIAKEIVLAHHGKIEAVSEPGEGAEFIVRLPSADTHYSGE